MAINDNQKLDFLWKKLGYGVTKTDINSIKNATNESIPSSLLIRGDKLWAEAGDIPATIPTSNTSQVELTSTETTSDLTASANRTWKTSAADWIPPEFGSTYQVKVYIDSAGAANPQSTGTQLFAAGSGNNDEWFFDYQSGVLNFIGDNLPSGISGNKIYVVGARYIGNFGISGTSDGIIEGSNNLYYTDERVDDRVADLIVDGVGITKNYDDAGNLLDISINFTEFDSDDIVEGAVNTFLASRSTDAIPEGSTNLYYTDARTDARIALQAGSNLDLSNKTTTDLAEGTNLYFTDERVDDRVANLIQAGANISLVYDDVAGTLTISATEDNLANNTTDDLAEGSTNLYYTEARVDANIASKDTGDLAEGSNLYYTDVRVQTYLTNNNYATIGTVTQQVAAQVGAIVSDLDDEIYDREQADINLQSQIDSIVTYSSSDFDTDFAAKSTTDLSEGSNLYYTQARFDSAFTAKSTTDLSEGSNLYYTDTRADARIALQSGSNLDLSSKDTDELSEGSTNLYYTEARVDANIATKDTGDLAEGSNLYYTDARVQTKLGSVSGHIIPDTDITYDLGSSTNKFRDLYLSGSSITLGTIELTDNGGALEVTPIGGGSTETFATETYVDTAVANLVDTAPTTLDTLNELAAALGDDPNFSTTITNLIGTKLATADFNTTADTWIGTKSTTDLTEGSNLYYTESRVDARIALQSGSNLDLSNKDTDDLSEGSTNLYYTDARVNSAFDTRLATKSTTDLAEGTNLYYTDTRVRAAISVTGDLTYDSATGVISTQGLASSDTDDLSEGSTNLYYTDARVQTYLTNNSYAKTSDIAPIVTQQVAAQIGSVQSDLDDEIYDREQGDLALQTQINSIVTYSGSDFDTDFAGKSTTDLAEGTNLYYTDARVSTHLSTNGFATETYVDNAVSNLIDTAPTTLDTLNELAAALNDDPNFSTTITNLIGTKLATADFNTTADTWIGTKSTTDLSEGTNLYYTEARVDARIALQSGSNLDLSNKDTDDLSEGSSNLYYTDSRADARVNLQTGANLDLSNKSTTNLVEGTNLYYTDARVDARITASNPYTSADFDTDFAGKSTTDLAEGTNLYYTQARFDSALSSKSTTDLSEGNNLYYTDARVDARITNAGLFDGDYNSLTNLPTLFDGQFSSLTGKPTTLAGYGITDGVSTSSVNAIVTQQVAAQTGAIQSDLDDEIYDREQADIGLQNQINGLSTYTSTDFDTDFATKSTTDLIEGTNLYYTDSRVASYLSNQGITSETTTTLSINGNILTYTDEDGTATNIDLSLYIDDTNLARLTSGSLAANGIATFTRDDASTFTIDFSQFFDDTNLSRIDSANFANGTLTLTRTDASTAATVNLDGRYLQNFVAQTTDDLSEGSTNLYYTDARVRGQLYSTVSVTTSSGKFYIDGEQQSIATLQPGRTYRFDQSAASNNSHPLRFSEVSDGTHAGGGATEYTTGVTVNGTAGNAGAYVEIVVTNATPRLYYYCANHSGMGGKVSVGKELFVERITSDTWITGPIQTTTVNVATGGSISAQLATLDFTNTTVNFSGASITGLSNSDVGLANIADNAQGVVVTGKVAAGSLDLAIGGSINAQLTTLDFRDTTVNFSGANVGGLDDTIQDEVDFHLNKNNAGGSTIISDGQVLSWNATGGLQGTGDYEWVAQSGGGASVTTSSTAPASPSDGDLWFDTDELKTYVYYNDGTSSQWVQSNPTGAIGGGGTSIEISDVAPTSPSAGDLWFDSDALKTFIYYDDGSGAQWIESSGGAGGGSSIADTDALSEGSTNLYYTDARVDTHLNVSSATNGQTLIWNGTDYSWGTPAPGYTSSDFDTDFATKSTTDVVEGTNLYYTDARVQTKLGDVSGHIIPDTDVTYDLGSSTHKFRDLYLSGNSIILGGITLTESSGELLVTPTGGGSNNTFATESFVNTAIANLVDTAPTTLDTLNELAAALGDDANFSVTITNSIATKLALSGGTMSGNIDMANNELLNVNYITFADPGPNEGLRWTGGNIEIFESPDDLTTNTAGNLQVTYSGTRRLSVSNTGIDVNGNITIPANATLSAGSSNKINIGNSSLDNVNKIFIADPGPNEGIEWLGGNAWQIYESPDDLVTNSGGNLQFVSGSPTSGIAPVRRMTLDVAGNLNLLTGSFIGNLVGNADTATTVSDISNHNTDDLSEGSTNLYYTESRVDARVAYAATGALSVTYTPKSIYAILKLTSNEGFSGGGWAKLDNFTTVFTDTSPSQAISDATNSRMTIPAGVEKVRVSAGARLNSVTGQAMIQIYHYDSNNNQLIGSADTAVGYNEIDSAGNDTATTVTPILEVNQGDYFEVWVYGQDAGTAIVNRATYFEMEVVEGSMLNSTVASTIELDHLSDVDTSTVAPTDGQALIWDNGNSEWKPGNVDVTSSDLDMSGNKVLFANMYATEGDLPSATTYHGMFAHVHSTGAGYFAHAGAWVKLANYSDIPSVYTDSAVDTHLNTSTAAANQVLSWNGTDYVWVAQASGGGGGASVSVSDTAPSSPSEGDLWFNSLNTKMYVYFDDGTSSQWIQSNPSGASTPITASDSAPSNPVENSMWFDSTDGTLYFRYNDGTSEQWVNLIGATSSGGGSGGSSVTISDTAPTSPTEGDMWFDSRYAVLLVYYGTQWVNVSGESGSSTIPSWQETTNHTASAGDKLFIDCSGDVVTVTLPASPSMGDEIRIIDATGNASTNNITVARNGNNIQGVADNLTIDTDRAAFGLVYYNSTQGWLLMER